MKYLRWILLCVLPCIGAVAETGASLPDDAPINLFVGDSRVLEVATTRIAVGNGKVLSAAPVSPQQVVLIGQAPGSTVLQLWLRDGSQRRIEVVVTPSDLQATLRAVQGMLQGVEGVDARLAGQRILLEGDSADARARERAAAIAGIFPGVVIDFVGKLGWESMVHVDVRIVEFRRGRLRELGIRWRDEINGPSAGVIADFVHNDRFRVRPENDPIPEAAFDPLPARTAARAYLGVSAVLDSRLRALEETGEALLVAEPRLSCRSGGAARFVAGGEIPVPVTNSVGATDVEFREYGVILDIKPVADAQGAIFVRVETELSQVDNAQRVAGIPGLLKRRSVTDVNLRSGETVVIAGLANRQRSIDTSGVPALARVPVMGRLFGVRGNRADESELVIFLTPRIESAEAPADTPELLQRTQERIESFGRKGA